MPRHSGPTIKDKLLALFRANRGKHFSTETLIAFIYGDREDGGAVTARTVIQVSISELRDEGHEIQGQFVYFFLE